MPRGLEPTLDLTRRLDSPLIEEDDIIINPLTARIFTVFGLLEDRALHLSLIHISGPRDRG